MAKEKVADLVNPALRCNQPYHKHKLDDRMESLVIMDSSPLQAFMEVLSRNPNLSCTNSNTAAYGEVFVDDFLGLYQGPAHRQRHV